MPDREKVIKALETCTRDDIATAEPFPCRECEYFVETTDDEAYDCMKLMMKDALALLTDTTTWIKEPNRRNHWHCEKCGSVVGLTAWMYTYCPVCGRRVTGEIEFDG